MSRIRRYAVGTTMAALIVSGLGITVLTLYVNGTRLLDWLGG